MLIEKEGAIFVGREEWLEAHIKLGKETRVELLLQAKETVCKSCVVNCYCSEMCEKFINRATGSKEYFKSLKERE